MTLERLGRQPRKSEKTPVTSLEVNRLTVTNPGKISKEFNNHFSTTGSKLDSEINADGGDYQRYLTCTDTRFHLHPTKQTVFLLKNKLNKSNTTGLKKIFARLIWECVDLVCGPICDISNHFIRQGKLQEDW